MYYKKNLLAIIIIFLLFLFSGLLIFIASEVVINIAMYIIAILMIIMAIGFLLSVKNYQGRDKSILIVQSILLIIFSVLLFVFPSALMRAILGGLLIILPLIKLFTVENKFDQFLKDLYKYILGVILLFSFDSILDIVVKAVGVLLLALGILLLIILFKNRHKDVNILYQIMIKFLLKKG